MLLFLSMLDTEEEQNKFVLLYDTYKQLLWYVANDILKDRQLAEDAVQETFLALTRHIEKVDEVHSAQTKRFLVTIVKSRAIDMLRREKRAEWIAYDDALAEEGDAGDVLDAYLQAESYDQLVEAIRSLDENDRVVLECRYLHELSEKETAALLGLAPKTVNVRIYRAKKKLKQRLQNIEGGKA
ncbi:MAG: sigma-70 family RNA polymerase sigma factor [Eubacterium sp.]|nr:sigma-70 family RNA polymerase sigma factor [Eubacterium sp.]